MQFSYLELKKSTETMIRKRLMVLFLVLAICSFCGKDFVSLGRYSWRCKSRLQINGDIDLPSISNTLDFFVYFIYLFVFFVCFFLVCICTTVTANCTLPYIERCIIVVS